MAVNSPARHRVNLVVVVPAELFTSLDKLAGEEGDRGKPEVVSFLEYVLHKNVWITAVVQKSTNISSLHGVNNEGVRLDALWIKTADGSKLFGFPLVAFFFFSTLDIS